MSIWVCIILLSLVGPQYADAIMMTRRAHMRMVKDKSGIYDGAWRFIPWDDFHHYPLQVQGFNDYLREIGHLNTDYVNGTTFVVPHRENESPDFRAPDEPAHAFLDNYKESGRYYRLMPGHLYKWRIERPNEWPQYLSCYCCLVYKRLTPLAMGAVISMRHILTSALATDVVLSKYKHKKTLENILGAWYNKDIIVPHEKYTNTVYYMTPARIIYHPRWNSPENTNRSHPIPCVFDLAVWTSTKTFWYWSSGWTNPADDMGYRAAMCLRWTNKRGQSTPPEPREVWVALVVGCQMVWSIDRKPYPWFKYALRNNIGSALLPICPKSDWDWYLCLKNSFGGRIHRFGSDVGAALHLCLADNSWRTSGLAGLNAFSTNLRSKHMVSYFTVLDRHPVLDFIYDVAKCRLVPNYLDVRFEQIRDKPLQLRVEGGQKVDESFKHPHNWYGYVNPYFN